MLGYVKIHHFLLGVFVMALVSFFVSRVVLSIVSVVLFIYFIIVVSMHFKAKKKKKIAHKKPISREQKALQKLKNTHDKENVRKHDYITSQVAYIADIWKLSQVQEKTFSTFIEKKAYSELYTKMTASLLPQLTKMIEECLARDMQGCKRDVSSRLNELVYVMKAEIARKKKQKKEDFETMRKVYDHLIDELS